MTKILIIDDMEDVLFSYKKALENLNYEVITADNGAEGVKLAQEEQPDLVILDIMMPGQDGWQVHNELKNNPTTSNIPVVFLTAKGDEGSKQKGTREAKAYIIKPITANQLDDLIRLVLED